jgi:geranylgeranyl diphosphate synthase type II
MRTIPQLLEQLTQYLNDESLDRQPKSLYEPIRYALSLGGKRMRPLLVLLAYQLYKEDAETAMPAAIAIEYFHNFTLLHDDVMDKADIRRGKPTVHKVWNETTAILSGDNMLILAFKHMADVPARHLKAVMNLFIETATQIDEGQQFDIDFEKRMDVTEEEYIEMIRLKTSVLLGCSMQLGAILADASEADARALYDFGINLGLSFQLQDDLLDVYGDPKTFGKKIGGDILCNKKTYMLIQALKEATPQQSTELKEWLTRENYEPCEKIAAVTHIYDEVGVRQMAEQKINYFFNAALDALDTVKLPVERKQVLLELAYKLLNRQS